MGVDEVRETVGGEGESGKDGGVGREEECEVWKRRAGEFLEWADMEEERGDREDKARTSLLVKSAKGRESFLNASPNGDVEEREGFG